jgi:hypothetical protein
MDALLQFKTYTIFYLISCGGLFGLRLLVPSPCPGFTRRKGGSFQSPPCGGSTSGRGIGQLSASARPGRFCEKMKSAIAQFQKTKIRSKLIPASFLNV